MGLNKLRYMQGHREPPGRRPPTVDEVRAQVETAMEVMAKDAVARWMTGESPPPKPLAETGESRRARRERAETQQLKMF